ncbi:transducin family protein / WD-40 repeat family protein [Wolffia australiana]
MAMAEAEGTGQAYRGLKKNYRCVQSLQQFYNGRPFAVSSDGSFLACACDDKIKLVNACDAAVRSELEGDTEAVTALALSPDDKFLFSASHSRLIRVWDLSSFKCVRSWKGHDGPVMGMACHSSGGLLATAGADKKVLVWDVDGGFCTHFFKGHGGVVTSIAFHPDPNCLLVFSGSEDATIRVWNLKSKKCIAVLEKHFSSVTSLAISERDHVLLSGGRDKVVNIWDLRDYSFQKTMPTYEMIEDVRIIFPGTHLASFIKKSEHKRTKQKDESPLPIQFLTVGELGIVRLWSSESAQPLYEQQVSDTTLVSEDNTRRGFISAAILAQDQGVICATSDQQFLFYNFNPASEKKLQLDLYRRLVGYNEEIIDLKFVDEDERHLAVATNLEEVRVYDVKSMSCSYVLTGHTDIVLCLDTCTLQSGEAYIVTGSKDNSARLWNAASKQCVGVASSHMGAVGAVAFSKKHKNFFVSGSSDRTLKVWGLDSLSENVEQKCKLKAKAVVAAHDKDINCIAVSPNDGFVCSGSQDRTACVWRLPDLVSVSVLKGHKRGIWSVEFSPVDQCVLTASGDKTIKYWLISDGTCLRTFEGHTAGVLRASFVTRGMQIVSSGADGLLKLWTVKTGECKATYDQHESKVWALAVGKKTEKIATGGGDAVINLWHDSTAADKEEDLRKTEEAALKSQELDNALYDKDFVRTIQLAFELRMPHKLLHLFSELFRERLDEDPIGEVVRNLGKDELRQLLEFVRDWNTRSQSCHVAQFVLFRIFKAFPPTDIIQVKGVRELLEGLIPYSQRHFSRVDRLARSAFLLDYTLTRMAVLEPDSEREAGVAVTGAEICTLKKKKRRGSSIAAADPETDGGDATTRPETRSLKKRKNRGSSKGYGNKIKDALDADPLIAVAG